MNQTLSRTLFAALAVSLCLSTNQAALGVDELTAKLIKADQVMKSGKAKLAVVMLRDLVRSNPDSAQAHMQLGAALATAAEKDDYDTAVLEEKQALKIDSKCFGARIILGHIYANQNKTSESIAILKEACEMRPTSFGAHRDLGIACLTGGKIDDAMAAFRKANELRPKNSEAHMKLSILLSKRGNFRDAIAEANEAVQNGNGDPENHLALANILLESGDENGSVDSFKNALRGNHAHNPLTEANALSGLGWAIASKDPGKNDVEEGILDQRRAIKTFPPFSPAYVRLAELLVKQDKNKEAEAVYNEGLKINPDDAGVGTSYAKFLGKLGRKDDAKTALKRVLEKSPQFKPASDELAALEQGSTK